MTLIDRSITSLPTGYYIHYISTSVGKYLHLFEMCDESLNLLKMMVRDRKSSVSIYTKSRIIQRTSLNNYCKGYVFQLTEDEFLLETSELI